jgi:hypothetical protein
MTQGASLAAAGIDKNLAHRARTLARMSEAKATMVRGARERRLRNDYAKGWNRFQRQINDLAHPQRE